MSANDLTGTEAAVLMVLMAEARAVKNPDLVMLGPKLEKPSRDKLVELGVIDVGKAGRSMTLELTDKGWKYCADLMGSEPPKGAAGPGKALFTVMAGLRRWFDREDARPSEIFFAPTPSDPSATATEPAKVESIDPAPGEIEQRIRKAYAELVREPGGALRLSRLRPALSDIPRVEVDEALARLRRAPDVSLIPEENQKTLSDDDRAAAVVVGNQHNHLLSIELS